MAKWQHMAATHDGQTIIDATKADDATTWCAKWRSATRHRGSRSEVAKSQKNGTWSNLPHCYHQMRETMQAAWTWCPKSQSQFGGFGWFPPDQHIVFFLIIRLRAAMQSGGKPGFLHGMRNKMAGAVVSQRKFMHHHHYYYQIAETYACQWVLKECMVVDAFRLIFAFTGHRTLRSLSSRPTQKLGY